MVHHIVLWDLTDIQNEQEKQEAAKTMKEKLESLNGKIAGLVSLQVVIGEKEANTREIALLSVFDSQEALDGYQIHPLHLEAAAFVRSVTCNRVCFDY